MVERDSTYAYASTPRSVGGVRVQFTCPENVQLSRFGAEFVANAPSELGSSVGFRPSGYLFLASPAGEDSLRRAHAVQMAAGAQVELLGPTALAVAYPWLCVDGIALGSRGTGEGAFDPHLFLTTMRQASVARGAEWLGGTASALLRGRGCESFDDVRRVIVSKSGACAGAALHESCDSSCGPCLQMGPRKPSSVTPSSSQLAPGRRLSPSSTVFQTSRSL